MDKNIERDLERKAKIYLYPTEVKTGINDNSVITKAFAQVSATATIAKIYGLGPKQKATLTNCIMETYAASGIQKANSISWKNEAPTFDQVYQRYLNDEDIKKGDSLSAAMDELGQYEVFEKFPSKTKSLFEVLKGVVVIDLSGYPVTLQNLIIAITLDLFYTQISSCVCVIIPNLTRNVRTRQLHYISDNDY